MKLGKELSKKLFFSLLIFGVFFEVSLVILISVRFKTPIKQTLKEIIKITEKKIITLNDKLNVNCNTLIYKYISDLKLITVHIVHYQLANSNSDKKFFSNYVERKKWHLADDYNYPNETNKNKYYNNTIKEFNYLDILEEKFKDNYDHNEIINTLFEETEFDLIGIYNYTDQMFNNVEMKISLFFISVLKSVYIRRYILKRNKLDYIRFILTQNNFSFIYPYDRSNNSKLISLFKKNINLVHEYNTNKCKDYISSIKTNYITFYSYFSNDIVIFCLVKFGGINETTSDKSQTICSEISTTKFLEGFFWRNQTEIDLSIVFLNNGEIEPLYHEESEYYKSIKETFNDDKYGEYKFESRIRLFHILYFKLFSKYSNYTFTNDFYEEILKEYYVIKQLIIDKINEIEESYCDTSNKSEKQDISIDVTKTNCYKNINTHEIKCQKDLSQIVLYAFLLETRQLDPAYYIDIEGTNNIYPIFYSISIIETNPNISEKNILQIMDNKTTKLFFFFLISLIVIIILVLIIMEIVNSVLLSSIYQIMTGLNIFDEMIEEEESNLDINKILKYENKILIGNKEMKMLNDISSMVKKMIILQIVINNKKENNEKYLNNSRLNNIILKMKPSHIKDICLNVLGYHHFKKRLYQVSENEFNLVLNRIINKEKKIILNNENIDHELKDIIKRFNDITYLNDNSILKGINETILPNIKIKFVKQKIVYLIGMCLYNEARNNLYKVKKNMNNMNMINMNNININNINNNNINQFNLLNNKKNNINNSFLKAIDNFDECRNINKLLGSNPIKEIFSLIMKAKCYIELKEYKKAFSSTSEALDLFFELEKTFKDTNNNSYSPCIMIFVHNIIFQNIMYNLALISYFSYKFHGCIYIIFKIFDTSPFIIKNIFYNTSFMLQNILIRTKFKKNSIIYDNTKRLYSKIFTRLYIRYYNNLNEINRMKMIYNITMNKRMSTKNDFLPIMNKGSNVDLYEPKKGSQRYKMSYSVINNNSSNKLINICVSEKILLQNNGIVLKDVLINYIDDCFYDNNDNDKFSYVQFTNNGKKNIFIKPEIKEIFLQKLKIDKIDRNKIENCYYESDDLFCEFYNLLNDFIELTKYNKDDIVSITNKFNTDDNIILMFIDTGDIRFNDKEDCKKIVYELNKNNFSLYLISYEEKIDPEKIKNIKSFISGLFDAHFFQIKNYQQIKQIFMNIASKQVHGDIYGYNFENIELFM